MAGYDAVLIAGGGVRAGGKLHPWVEARFDLALSLCGEALLMPLSAGTPHRAPPLDEQGFPILEAEAGARYLLARGIPARRILIEACSFDTIGNAYFSRVVHAIPRGLTRLLVITSEFHMPRTEIIFRWVYGLPGPGEACAVEFRDAPNIGIDPALLSRRIAREQASLDLLRSVTPRIHSLEELNQWLFTSHGAYSAGSARPPFDDIDDATY